MNRPLAASILALFLGATALSACPGPHFYGRGRAMRRSCFANMKTLAGAIEMRDLDRNERFLTSGARLVTAELQETLLKEGYLQSKLADPGTNPPEYERYYVTAGGDGIFCIAHGTWSREGPAREQLAGLGIDDPVLRAAAWEELPPEPRPPFWTLEMLFALAALALNEAFCWGYRRHYAPRVPIGTRLFAWIGRRLVVLNAGVWLASGPAFQTTLLSAALLQLMVMVGIVSTAIRLGIAGFRRLSPVLVPELTLKGAAR